MEDGYVDHGWEVNLSLTGGFRFVDCIISLYKSAMYDWVKKMEIELYTTFR